MKAFRMSGLPISLADIEACKKEFTEAYDVLAAKHGPDMLALQTDVAEVEKQIQSKYSYVQDWKFLNKKQILAKIEELGCPVLVAKSAQNPKELVYVIWDQQ